jgi:pyruvate kinase
VLVQLQERDRLKKTKIICTIGPASISKDTLRKMYCVGMNGAGINTAYGTLRQYSLMISRLREIGDIPIVVDLKRPELRI